MKKLLFLLSLFISLTAAGADAYSVAGLFPLHGSGRVIYNFNQGWRFHLGDAQGAEAVSYDDSRWTVVCAPHTARLEPADASGGRNYQGIVWYRKHFTVPADMKGKDVTVHFEAIMGKQDIFVNGKKVKSHLGGYLPITINLAELGVKAGDKCLIAVKADIKNIYENFTDKHARSLSEFDSMVYEISDNEAQLKSDFETKTKTLSGLGSINYMAPEEFKEVKERYDFLSEQIKDLETAKKDLEKVTEKIKSEATDLFEEAFKKIRKNFHSMFRRLFGGGNAEIRLTDTSDILNSGIEILAEPPGLKLQSIGLLSGGQRSMTSVALIFAIFMVKPSPFCLLDEIDAALDESNIGHFISTLQEFSRQSQFIIITHNKKTAAAASSIIGVTMPKAGISAVFSTHLDNESRNYREKRLAQIEEAEEAYEIQEN